MTCQDTLPLLRDLVDRELGADEARQVGEHCVACRDCGGRLEAERDLKRAVRERFRPGPAPAGLAGAIARRVREEAGRPGPWGSWWSMRPVRYAAVAAVLVAAAVGVRGLLVPSPVEDRPASAMASELVDDHIRYAAVQAPTEVATTDPAEAERWFAPRLGTAVPLPRFERQGMRLLGGRLCYVLDRRVALLFYEWDGRRDSLFVMDPAGLSAAPAPEDPFSVARAVETVKGYRVACWTKAGRMYALVSDRTPEELGRLVAGAYGD